nr:MAG TPA: hypothetical protein [Caudoviricetes sp.]
MKTRFGLKAMTALLFNAVMGIMLAAFMGVSGTAGGCRPRRDPPPP